MWFIKHLFCVSEVLTDAVFPLGLHFLVSTVCLRSKTNPVSSDESHYSHLEVYFQRNGKELIKSPAIHVVKNSALFTLRREGCQAMVVGLSQGSMGVGISPLSTCVKSPPCHHHRRRPSDDASNWSLNDNKMKCVA